MTQTTNRTMSGPLVLAAVGSFAVGVLGGVLLYATRSDVRERHTPGTAAWPQHAVVAAVALLALALAARGGGLRHRLLAPVSGRAARRLRRTLRHPGPRAVVTAVLVALLVYSGGRAGLQVTAGLDPNFTADAWGGPGYVGALACHYLDGALIIAAAAVLLDRVLLPDPMRPGPAVPSSP